MTGSCPRPVRPPDRTWTLVTMPQLFISHRHRQFCCVWVGPTHQWNEKEEFRHQLLFLFQWVQLFQLTFTFLLYYSSGEARRPSQSQFRFGLLSAHHVSRIYCCKIPFQKNWNGHGMGSEKGIFRYSHGWQSLSPIVLRSLPQQLKPMNEHADGLLILIRNHKMSTLHECTNQIDDGIETVSDLIKDSLVAVVVAWSKR